MQLEMLSMKYIYQKLPLAAYCAVVVLLKSSQNGSALTALMPLDTHLQRYLVCLGLD